MKILPNIAVAIIAVIVGALVQYYYPHLLIAIPRPILNTVTVRGDSPSAPVPMTVDLQLHKDGSVTWKKP